MYDNNKLNFIVRKLDNKKEIKDIISYMSLAHLGIV
jgi:ribosomal protein L23